MEYKSIEEVEKELGEKINGYIDGESYLYELVEYIKENYKLIKIKE